MTPDAIVNLITTVGFPIVCCGGLGWWVKYTTDKEREERIKMTEEHRNEMKEVTQALNNNNLALNNNTLVIQKLCDKLDRE